MRAIKYFLGALGFLGILGYVWHEPMFYIFFLFFLNFLEPHVESLINRIGPPFRFTFGKSNKTPIRK